MKILSLRAAGREGIRAYKANTGAQGVFVRPLSFSESVWRSLQWRVAACAINAFVHGASSSALLLSICTRTETVSRDEAVQSSKKEQI